MTSAATRGRRAEPIYDRETAPCHDAQEAFRDALDRVTDDLPDMIARAILGETDGGEPR